jgi:hypothetical protein
MDRGHGAGGSRGRPAGIPVSRAIDILPGVANDDLREAVAAISRVHGDGDLPPIPMSMRTRIVDGEGRPVDGLFSFDVLSDGPPTARSIQIRRAASHRPLVAVHEIGHFLDLHGLPGFGFASADDRVAMLDNWRRAVVRSRALGRLRELAASGDSVLRDRAGRLLQADELWARSYAQYVATRSDHTSVRAGLDAMRSRESDDVYLPQQWDDDDFAEIDAAIEELFRGLRWID